VIRCHRLDHRFVSHFPDRLEPGVLYVSTEYGTATHTCCCGCGEEVVTPFSPTGWKMTYDGETVSLWPSVGSWTLACRSHYVIDRGRVLEAGRWNESQIAAARQRDNSAAASAGTQAARPPQPTSVPAAGEAKVTGWWARFRRWLSAPWR
jgi:hypothetical protein